MEKESPEFSKTKWLRYLSVFTHQIRLMVTLQCTEEKELQIHFFIFTLFFITCSEEEPDTKELKLGNILEATQRTVLQGPWEIQWVTKRYSKSETSTAIWRASTLAQTSKATVPYGSCPRGSCCTPFATSEKAGSHESLPVTSVLPSA